MEVQTPHEKEHFEGYAPDNIRSKSKVGQSPPTWRDLQSAMLPTGRSDICPKKNPPRRRDLIPNYSGQSRNIDPTG